MFIRAGGTADPQQCHHGPVLVLAEVTFLSLQDQPGPTRLGQHQLFHGNISPPVQTGAVGGAGSDEVTQGFAMPLLALRCPIPTALAPVCDSPHLTGALPWPQGCPRLVAMMLSALSLRTQANASCRDTCLSAQKDCRAGMEAPSPPEGFCLLPLYARHTQVGRAIFLIIGFYWKSISK